MKLDLEDQPAGHHEIALVSPKLDVSEMLWQWGSVYKKPDRDVNLLWETDLPAGIQSRPVFYYDLVIVGANDGGVYAVSSDKGLPRWKFSGGVDSVLSSPIIYRDRLYFGTIGEQVVCLNPHNGQKIWSTPVEGSVIATSRIAGKLLVVGTGKGWMLGIDPESGDIKWRYQVGGLIKATPAYDGTSLYFGAWDGNFYAVNVDNGTEVWNKHMAIPHLSPATCNPGILNGRIVVVTHDYATHCLDSHTGDDIWKFPKGYDKFDWQSPLIAKCKPSYSSPVFYKGVAYMTSITGHVVGIDVMAGEQKLSLDVGEEIFDSFPALIENQLYFGTLRGKFVGVDLDSIKMNQRYSLGHNFIFSPPGANDEAIAIGNLGGRLACFGK